MVEARCDCGAVHIEIDAPGPDAVWDCPCTICQKLGVLWAYYRPEQVRVVAAPDATSIYQRARPNAAHHAVVALERAGRVAAVVTQNVDGLHRRAGTSPELLIEMHGTDLLVECQSCRAASDPAPHFDAFRATRRPPMCACGGILKPATISFGQSLRADDIERASAAASRADLGLRLDVTVLRIARAVLRSETEQDQVRPRRRRGGTPVLGQPKVGK